MKRFFFLLVSFAPLAWALSLSLVVGQAASQPPGGQNPAGQTPAGQVPAAQSPAGGAQQPESASAAAPIKPAPLAPAELQSLLQKVYMAAFRASDVLTLLKPEDWKIDDTGRKSFNQTLDSLREQLKTLEQWRYQFAGQPQNADFGERTVTALAAARTSLEAVSTAVAQYEGPSRSADYKKSAAELSGLEQKLRSHLASLQAPAAELTVAPPSAGGPSKPGAPSSQLQTERIEARAAAPPPATTVETPESMRVYQAKVLLHKLYVATFRLKDLLGLVHPERWSAPQPLRDSFKQETGVLRNHLISLDELRTQFDDRPEDAFLGFQTYTAIAPVIEDLKHMSQSVAQFEGRATSNEFTQPVQWLAETQHDLQPYLGFILRNREQAIHGYQADLAACQNTLNYALRPKAAVPMPNIMPVLKGVRHVRRVTKTSEDAGGATSKKRPGRARASR